MSLDDRVSDLVDAIRGTPCNTGPGTGTYPLSHAVYDIAKAISDHQSIGSGDLFDAASMIKEGLDNIASAIRETRS